MSITQEPVTSPSTSSSSSPPPPSLADDNLLTYRADEEVVVRAIQPPHSFLSTATPSTFTLSPSDLDHLQTQVCRMLRLHPSPLPSHPNPFSAFYALMPTARARGFARLFHSPTVFEDFVKTVTLCNVNWKGTILMNHTLSTLIGLGPAYQLTVTTCSPAYHPPPSDPTSPPHTPSVIAAVISRPDAKAELTGGELLVRHSITLGAFPSPLRAGRSGRRPTAGAV